MADSFFNLENEALPSFSCSSLDSTVGPVTFGNATLGSDPGLPLAASTVVKTRAATINRQCCKEIGSAHLSDKHIKHSFEDIQCSVQDVPESGSGSSPERLRGGAGLPTLASTCCQYILNAKEGSQMPDVHVAATGMDTYPTSEEYDDYLEAAQMMNNSTTKTRLKSTSTELVGEDNHYIFRPGLEGRNCYDEPFVGHRTLSLTHAQLEHRQFDEGPVIDASGHVNGSIGREGNGSDGVSTVLPTGTMSTTCDFLGGMGIVESSTDEADNLINHLRLESSNMLRHIEMVPRLCEDKNTNTDCMDEADCSSHCLALRGGQCDDFAISKTSESSGDDDCNMLSTSLEPKYLTESFQQEKEESDSSTLCNVVYQNEEGLWVTDLAYYSCFEKEVDAKTLDGSMFLTEDFIPSCNAVELIASDQEEFERVHQFMQEEQIEMARSSPCQINVSWGVHTGSQNLMGSSSASSEFEQADASYLRLSLGQFFSERSEALGSLGYDVECIKRPSFGYIITSPEKREPFALIPSLDFSPSSGSLLNEATQLSDANKSFNPHIMDKTDERLSTSEDTDQALNENKGCIDPLAEPNISHVSSNVLSTADKKSASPDNNTTNTMLSISTIASAIADASISSDPSQLADMIMELSKRKGNIIEPYPARCVGSASAEEKDQDKHIHSEDNRISTCVSNTSAFDMDNYLKKTDFCDSEDKSVVHTSFNITRWANDLCSSQVANFAQICNQEFHERITEPCEKDETAKTHLKSGMSAAYQFVSQSNTSPDRGNAKKSSSHQATSNSVRRLVGSQRSSTQKFPAVNNIDATVWAEISVNKAPPLKTCSSSGKMSTKDEINRGVSYTERRMRQQQHDKSDNSSKRKLPPMNPVRAPASSSSAENVTSFSPQLPSPSVDCGTDLSNCFSAPSTVTEELQCNFRPSTSPLTHSSPSQTSLHSAVRVMSSPCSNDPLADEHSTPDHSPKSACLSTSFSRLTYISVNDCSSIATPDQQKSNSSMTLSTTIIRFSPTPPVEPDAPTNLEGSVIPHCHGKVKLHHLKTMNTLQQQCEEEICSDKQPSASYPVIGCCCRERDYNQHCAGEGPHNSATDSRHCKHHSDYTKEQQPAKMNLDCPPEQSIQQPGANAKSKGRSVDTLFANASNGLDCIPISSFKPLGCGLRSAEVPQSLQSIVGEQLVLNSHQALQHLSSKGPLHRNNFQMGATDHGIYGVSSDMLNSAPKDGHSHPISELMRVPVWSCMVPSQHQYQEHMTCVMGTKSSCNFVGCPVSSSGSKDVQLVLPVELQFPHACCVGIASQTSLNIFNPSKRWQHVSSAVSRLTIDGEVCNVPHHVLVVKNKTIIGPRSTEDLKVMFIPQKAGVYQCVFNIWSWPASVEPELGVQASIFAQRVMMNAVAENPALKVEVGNFDSLDFGDLPGGSAKALPLTLHNSTPARVPIRLLIRASRMACCSYRSAFDAPVVHSRENATAWQCFALSMNPVTTKSDVEQVGCLSRLSAVMNYVMPASNENQENLMIGVHFKAPHNLTLSEELGPANEYTARVDIEVDCPGPSHVIRSIPLRARSGTARVHAPKNLQSIKLCAPLGTFSQQTLPLKNAGNIDVQLQLRIGDPMDCFSVSPEILSLKVGEEHGVVVSFKPKGSNTLRESLLTISVLPSGPQYQVPIDGEVAAEDCAKVTSIPTIVCGSGPPSNLPSILSNKQIVVWGGVGLGQAVQQKVVLRNNSPNVSQQLRLLIRGRDQDCFQLQSLFSPDQCSTRHGEFSISPGEDITIRLLFAPTRVACMSAKLEIKPSGVQSAQPGIKFTIPLSGYGGTSNIILENQSKQAEGYVVTLADIAVGCISKVCLCIRNTGSRAAFIKAMASHNGQIKMPMEPSVFSISPSQFILRERTQEMITVMIKATEREYNLCQSASGLLGSVCLLWGDEVSRCQYRRFLQTKPHAGQKGLSENSPLNNVDFSEVFMGEEHLTEICDLPLSPDEAHIFYRNICKVVVSLLGSLNQGPEERGPGKMLLAPPSPGHGLDVGFANCNVSLDVLPVKGPQGPNLKVTESSLKMAQKLSESWSMYPEQLVLMASTMEHTTITREVEIQNNTSRQLNFDISWPAHWLTVSPQHGVLEPKCCMQILISPNPALVIEPSFLPWKGHIYVQCDGQQKVIKVQIRLDLALDVSTATANMSLTALAQMTATPVLPVNRISTKLSLTPIIPQCLSEISNKTVIFPATHSGETSEAKLEVKNGEVDVRWYLSSFAPPYIKGIDNTANVYRLTYAVFRCSKVSGTLGAQEKMQVPVTFLPRDSGDYAQFWDLECHTMSDPQQKSRIRFQLCGTGVKFWAIEGSHKGDSCVKKTEGILKTKRKIDSSTSKINQEEAMRKGVYSAQDVYIFPDTEVGGSSTLKVNIRNNSSEMHELKFENPVGPFFTKHTTYSLRSHHYLKLPIQFKPCTAGRHTGILLIQSETSGPLVIQLRGDAVS